MSDHLGRRMAVRTCPQASRHSWQRPRLHSWLTRQARGWPTAGIGSGTLNTRADSPEATQNVLFCAFATDRQLTAEAAHIGGSVRGQVARRVATFREQHPDPGTPLALSECERWPRRSDFQGGTVSGARPAGEYGHRLRQAGGSVACLAGFRTAVGTVRCSWTQRDLMGHDPKPCPASNSSHECLSWVFMTRLGNLVVLADHAAADGDWWGRCRL
jgi:hypothetical protein